MMCFIGIPDEKFEGTQDGQLEFALDSLSKDTSKCMLEGMSEGLSFEGTPAGTLDCLSEGLPDDLS